MYQLDRFDPDSVRDRCMAIRREDRKRPEFEDYLGNPVRLSLFERFRLLRERHPFGVELVRWYVIGFIVGAGSMALALVLVR